MITLFGIDSHRAGLLCSDPMRCGPLLDVFPTGEPGGFRLVGDLNAQAAEPLWSILEPVARSGLGLTLECGGIVSVDATGLGVIVRTLAFNRGSAVLVTGVPPHVVDEFDRTLPAEHPMLLVLPAA
jgi:ABC-type transporter Mla MlaB component